MASPGPAAEAPTRLAAGPSSDSAPPLSAPAPAQHVPEQQPPQQQPRQSLDDRVAVCGYTIHLPGDITTGEQLFEMCRQKVQCRRDMVALGRYPASLVDASAGGTNPWKLKTRYCNMFSEEEGASGLLACNSIDRRMGGS